MSEDRPARVKAIKLGVTLPVELTASERATLQAVVEHCTVHNSIRQPPEVRIEVSAESQAA